MGRYGKNIADKEWSPQNSEIYWYKVIVVDIVHLFAFTLNKKYMLSFARQSFRPVKSAWSSINQVAFTSHALKEDINSTNKWYEDEVGMNNTSI